MCEIRDATSTPNKSFTDMSNSFSNFVPLATEDFSSYPLHVILTEDGELNLNFDTSVNQRIERAHWICEYSNDIFETLRECEQKRCSINFESSQFIYNRPMLLDFLKVATEEYKLSRTTLHLAVYLLDGFLDNYTMQLDKLNLTAISCLIVAAKVEEVDVNMPKFADLNKLVGGVYMLSDFKNVEKKVLRAFDFDLIRPTVATFVEYFANNFITLEDYHVYGRNWRETAGFQQITTNMASGQCPCVFPMYATYEEMVSTLSKILFELADISLNYINFVNERQSVIAAACIAAVRQLHNVVPVWTPYLIKFTQCSDMMVTPHIDTLIGLYEMHVNKVILETNISNSSQNYTTNSVLCDSPDSGIVLVDIKDESSEDEELDSENDSFCDSDEDSYSSFENPIAAKKMRLF